MKEIKCRLCISYLHIIRSQGPPFWDCPNFPATFYEIDVVANLSKLKKRSGFDTDIRECFLTNFQFSNINPCEIFENKINEKYLTQIYFLFLKIKKKRENINRENFGISK